ncbi:glycerol-3-phosphate dehydrogenase C-terminal domain-containing protein [Pseudomonas aeruginosa]|nr:glycerol-3-phosphate dehydrogenase C-terminal domain-containing protein [Pseudomonas aeruginosa]
MARRCSAPAKARSSTGSAAASDAAWPVATDATWSASSGWLDTLGTDCVGASETLWAELAFAAEAEMVLHLDDLLLRRTRLGLLLPGGGAHTCRVSAHLPSAPGLGRPALGT